MQTQRKQFTHMAPKYFDIPVRIYWEDTDAGGIVYHSNYLKFLERGRTDRLRSIGFEQNAMKKSGQPIFVVAGIEINYRRPAQLDDMLTVRTRLIGLRRASFIFEQKIYRDDQLMTTATVRCASVDPVKGNPVVLPDSIFNSLLPYLDTEN